MKQILVILTIASSPTSDITPLLLESLAQEQIQHVSLLARLSEEEITERYALQEGEETVMVRLSTDVTMRLSARRIEQGLQQLIDQLETAGNENILLLGCGQFSNLQAENAVLLEPDRLIPPLVKAMVEGHLAGIIVPAEEPLRQQAIKWRNLSPAACFATATPARNNEALIDAGLLLLEQGAEVVVLDGAGYHSGHSDLLQRLLGIPVLLAWRPLVKMAAELLV